VVVSRHFFIVECGLCLEHGFVNFRIVLWHGLDLELSSIGFYMLVDTDSTSGECHSVLSSGSSGVIPSCRLLSQFLSPQNTSSNPWSSSHQDTIIPLPLLQFIVISTQHCAPSPCLSPGYSTAIITITLGHQNSIVLVFPHSLLAKFTLDKYLEIVHKK
jgi:hypothetical protein